MKASEYIKKIQEIIDEHGDLDCAIESDYDGRRTDAIGPSLDHALILSNRQKVSRFASYGYFKGQAPDILKGEPLIKIG